MNIGWNVSKDGSLTGTRGDSARIVMTWKDPTGTVYDLTGCTVKAQIRSKPNGYLILEFTPDNTYLNVGKIILTASKTDTEAINKTEGVWDVQVTFPITGVVKTVIGPSCPVIIEKDTTP